MFACGPVFQAEKINITRETAEVFFFVLCGKIRSRKSAADHSSPTAFAQWSFRSLKFFASHHANSFSVGNIHNQITCYFQQS